MLPKRLIQTTLYKYFKIKNLQFDKIDDIIFPKIFTSSGIQIT